MVFWKWRKMAREILQMQGEFLECMKMVEKAIGDQGWGGIMDSWNKRRELYMKLFEKRRKW